MQFSPVNYMASDVALSLAQSFREVGFALLSNHPISTKLIIENYLGWKEFFVSQDKFNYLYDKKSLDGYFPFGLEKAREGKKRDLKEFFYFYAWGKCPPYLKEQTLELYDSFINLGTEILGYIEEFLPVDIRNNLSMPFSKMVANTPRAVLRLLHYPPIDTSDTNLAEKAQEGAVRAIEHEDLTLISIVTPLDGPGLQLKDLAGQWHEIPSNPAVLVINIGDMLELCTQGFYRATTHRVVNPIDTKINQSRYANAFFFNPCDEVRLDKNHTARSCLEKHINKKLEYYEPIPEMNYSEVVA